MQRQQWIDVLRGIGIVFVVLGHVAPAPMAVDLVFMFHMPLFFLIGGWLHRESMPQADYLRSRAFGLLLPYICYLLILWPLELRAAYPDQHWDAAFVAHFLLKPMLLGGPLLKGYAAVFWFVTCYFLTQQLVHCLVRNYSRKVCLLLFCAMLLCAYLQAWWLPQRWLPWSAHTVLFAAPLYYLGYRAREFDIERYTALFCIVSAAGVALNLAGLHNRLDLKYLDYGIPLITLASAVACCALLALLAQRLEKRGAGKALAAGFASLGTASMTIMFTHQFIHLAMAKQLGLDNAVLRIVAALALGWLLHKLLLRQSLLARLFVGVRPARMTLPSASLAI